MFAITMIDANGSTAALALSQLLRSPEPMVREAAWERLITSHTRILMCVARSFGGDYDAAMERYSYILEKCREGDFRRLRAFDLAGGATFSTWLTVTARRLCLDLERTRYGRNRTTLEASDAKQLRARRRALANAIGAEIDIDLLPDRSTRSAEESVIQTERSEILQSAVALLSPRERLLLSLRFDDGLSASRIASVLGLPTPFHVYRELNSSLAKLRNALLSRGFHGSTG